MTASDICRRCHKGLVPEEKPEPSPAPLVLVPEPISCSDVNIGATVRELRLQRKLSQNDLAQRLGTARSWISKVESDKLTPTVSSLDRIAKALKVDISTLLREPSARLMSDPFIAELAVYASQLTGEQRSVVLDRVRELATAK